MVASEGVLNDAVYDNASVKCKPSRPFCHIDHDLWLSKVGAWSEIACLGFDFGRRFLKETAWVQKRLRNLPAKYVLRGFENVFRTYDSPFLLCNTAMFLPSFAPGSKRDVTAPATTPSPQSSPAESGRTARKNILVF